MESESEISEIGSCTEYNTLNITNSSVAIQLLYSDSERLVFSIVLPLILIFGVSCNSAFLFVVAKIKRLHTITNYYLVCIAIADITFVSISIGSYLVTFFSSPIRNNAAFESSFGCGFVFAITLAMYFDSMALITLVTLERYFAICIPLKHRAIAGMRRTFKIIIGTTIVSVILGILVALKDSKLGKTCIIWPENDDRFKGFPPVIKDCVALHPDVIIMGEVLQTVPFFVAMIWNGYMYFKIIYTLNSRNATKITEDRNSELQAQATRVRNQVARLLILNGTFFFALQVTYRFVAIHVILKLTVGTGLFSSDETLGLIVIVSRGCLYLNSSINPILYNLSSSFYYEAFKEAFGCKGKQRKLEISASTAISIVSSNRQSDDDLHQEKNNL